MNTNIVIIGKSGCGKTAVIDALEEVYYKNDKRCDRLYQYTTRPSRGIIDKSYIFLDDEEMDEMLEKCKNPYLRSYEVCQKDGTTATWRYALTLDVYKVLKNPCQWDICDYVLDADLLLAEMIAKTCKITVVYLRSDFATRYERLKGRGTECDEEIERRMTADDRLYNSARIDSLAKNHNVHFIEIPVDDITAEKAAEMIFTCVKQKEEEDFKHIKQKAIDTVKEYCESKSKEENYE